MSKPPNKPIIIILHETIAQSWATDASTFALFAALIGLGWLLDSNAMQWVGAVIAFLSVTFRASGKTAKRLTISEARAELDKIEAGKC